MAMSSAETVSGPRPKIALVAGAAAAVRAVELRLQCAGFDI